MLSPGSKAALQLPSNLPCSVPCFERRLGRKKTSIFGLKPPNPKQEGLKHPQPWPCQPKPPNPSFAPKPGNCGMMAEAQAGHEAHSGGRQPEISRSEVKSFGQLKHRFLMPTDSAPSLLIQCVAQGSRSSRGPWGARSAQEDAVAHSVLPCLRNTSRHMLLMILDEPARHMRPRPPSATETPCPEFQFHNSCRQQPEQSAPTKRRPSRGFLAAFSQLS